MNWIKRSENEPIVKRILAYSVSGNIHVLHWDYDDWLLSETDEDFPGSSVEFTHWMPLPPKPQED